MEKDIKPRFKNMMIKLFICLTFFSCQGPVNNQNKEYGITENVISKVTKTLNSRRTQEYDITEIGLFDNDGTKDTIDCRFVNGKEGAEPFYDCKLSLSSKSRKRISIPVISKSLQITNCGKGCLETYEWITGSDGFEEIKKYQYDSSLSKWILTTTVTIESGEETETKPKNLTALGKF